MKNNLKEIKTTIMGILMFVLGLAYFGMPYFSEKELWEVNTMYLAFLIVGGILLLLAPDDIISIVLGKLRRKAREE